MNIARLLCVVWCVSCISSYGAGDDEPPWLPYEGDLRARAIEVAEGIASRYPAGGEERSILVETIASELELIYAYDQRLATVTARLQWVPGSIIVSLNSESDAALTNGSSVDWAAFRAEWGSGVARRLSTDISRAWWVITMDAPHYPPALSDWVKTHWNGVIFVEPNYVMGDSHDVLRFPGIRGYAFIYKWGDCPSGCIYSATRAVVLSADDSVLEVEHEGESFLELVELEYPSVLEGSLGDTLVLRELAWFETLGTPRLRTSTQIQWAMRDPDGVWTPVGDRYELSDESAFHVSLGLEVRDPTDSERWWIPVQVYPIERHPGVRGERVGNHWLLHSTGWLNDTYYPWLWHFDHGWLWLSEAGSDAHGWWVWDLALGWVYSGIGNDPDGYPYIYNNGRWLFYEAGSTHPRRFYDYRATDWIMVD